MELADLLSSSAAYLLGMSGLAFARGHDAGYRPHTSQPAKLSTSPKYDVIDQIHETPLPPMRRELGLGRCLESHTPAGNLRSELALWLVRA